MKTDNIYIFSSKQPFIVKRAVYEAALKMEENCPEDVRRLTSFELFDWKKMLCNDNDNSENVLFWKEVYQYLKIVRISSGSFDNLDKSPIIVDIDVYEAALKIEKDNLSDTRAYTDWNQVEEQIEICCAKGDEEGIAFFGKVRTFLMETEFLSKEAKILIIRED